MKQNHSYFQLIDFEANLQEPIKINANLFLNKRYLTIKVIKFKLIFKLFHPGSSNSP